MNFKRRHLWLIPAAFLILLALARILGPGPAWKGAVSLLCALWFLMMAAGMLDSRFTRR
jgi:hypothetical protein